MSRLVALALALLVAAPAQAGCPGTRQGITDLAAASSAAYAALDVDAFRRAARDLEVTAACAVDPADATLARELYRISALLAWSARDERGTREALRALVRADPAFDLDLAVAPEGSGLRELLVSVRAEPPAADVALGPDVTVAGAASGSVQSGQRAWLQRPDGAALASWYGSSSRVPGAFRPPDPDGHRSRTLAVVGGAVVALGVTSLGIAEGRKQVFLDQELARPEGERVLVTNRAFGIAGYSLCGVGATLGAVAVVQGRW